MFVTMMGLKLAIAFLLLFLGAFLVLAAKQIGHGPEQSSDGHLLRTWLFRAEGAACFLLGVDLLAHG